MLFIDKNNTIYQIKLSHKVSTLLKQKAYYEKEIAKVNTVKEELFSTSEKKEKFAREKYYMKKDNEDVFVISEE